MNITIVACDLSIETPAGIEVVSLEIDLDTSELTTLGPVSDDTWEFLVNNRHTIIEHLRTQ